MTHELEIALFAMWDVLKKECGPSGYCVAVDIRFTADNYWVNYENKRDCVSMQNIYGEFIRCAGNEYVSANNRNV